MPRVAPLIPLSVGGEGLGVRTTVGTTGRNAGDARRTLGRHDRREGEREDGGHCGATIGLDAPKKTLGAPERDLVLRALFADEAASQPAERVIVLDETSTHRDMHPLSLAGMGPALAVEGAVNTSTFLTYLRELRLPTLRPGDILVLDKLGSHKTDAVRVAVEIVPEP